MLPSVSRQPVRQITIPRYTFLEKEITGVGEYAVTLPLELEGGNALAGEAGPPIGYGLELLSLYMPFYALLEYLSAEKEHEAETTTIISGSLRRRGVVLWEGSPQLVTLNPQGTMLMIGSFGVIFNNPLIVANPSELTFDVKVFTASYIASKKEAVPFRFIVPSLEWANARQAQIAVKTITPFIRPGAIGYVLGAL